MNKAFTPIAAGQCRGHGLLLDLDGFMGKADEVRDALRHITDSRGFARSPRLQRFLKYIVEETLAGRGDQLKEYSIAVDVFERDTSYDPQTNSLVRVEASRLRAKLDKYNSTVKDGGQPAAAITISLPTGSYVPTFTLRKTVGQDGGGPYGGGLGDADPGDSDLGASELSGIRSEQTVSKETGRHPLLAVLMGFAVFAALLVAGHWSMFWRENADAQEVATEEVLPQGMPTIAVMPLRNISEDVEDDFLGDGLTDALITSLAREKSVRVIAYSSTRSLQKNQPSHDSIAQTLGVSHVVEGTVLREGGVVRITAKLIEAGTGRYLWAESYDRPIVELLSLQADVAKQIVASLSAVVTESGDEAVAHAADASDPAAQEAYLMGRYFRNMATESGFRKGISYFKDAIARDPGFAEAYSGMAACYCVLGGHGFELVDPREGMPLAKQAIAEAMRLNDGLAEAHAFAGIIHLKYDWDWAGAEQAFRRSIELNPSYAQAHLFYSYFLEAMDDPQGAVREAEEARKLDPLSLPLNANLIWQYLRAGRMEDALERLDWTRELNPGFWAVHWGYGHYYRQQGDLDRAIMSFEQAVKVGGGHAMPIADLGYTYALAGREDEARDMLARLKAMTETDYVSPYTFAVIHMGLGETDAAFAELEEAYRVRSRSLAWLKVAHEFDSVRDDPRFRSLIERVGLPL